MNPIMAISKSLLVALKGAEIINEVDKLIESKEFEVLKTVSLASRTNLLFLSILEIALYATNQSFSKAGELTKIIETGFRMVDTPIQITEGILILSSEASTSEKIRSVEKKFLSPFLGLLRSVAECDLRRNQLFMNLSPEEQEKLQIPIYEYDSISETCVLVGYRPFNREECMESIHKLDTAVTKLTISEVIAEAGVVSKVIGVSTKAFDLLTHRMFSAAIVRQKKILEATTEHSGDKGLDEQEDLFDLLGSTHIPPELQNDKLFQKFQCSLSFRAIRHVVSDPTTDKKIYYDRRAIDVWLSKNLTSPISGLPLLPSQLVSCVAIQILIDQRLELYSNKLKDNIRRIQLEPIDQAAVDRAIFMDRS